ncbi:NADP-dependent oxidoreductase [Actinoplanes sp. TRM 88003]|uniref:NADP-dependent oxidoreductase n=1 Tax=Paractinoplanes aksuensis TaxID=2939490 RepID=A0ABT1DR44_9ACTN|nr:NADP-dependent oxidoreductase [Actinoplanes aksuensis]MCO8273314.1 NADP-dependent oxidoreductase [Actinoplanes aksuensis]
MRAAVFDRFGPPEVLHVVHVPDPRPGPGEVRVRVLAAGVQPFDVAVRAGEMPWAKIQFPQTLGQEYAGLIDAVGEGVDDFVPGDPVLGSTMLNGAAELLCVAAENVVRKPAALDFPTAAALVAASQTASGSLLELGVGEGDVLLMHAAAGSVGTVATQLARRAGATVIGTASLRNHDRLRRQGAIPVTYGQDLIQDVRDLGLQPTAALDAAGGEAIAQSVELGIPLDRIGTIVDDKAAADHGTRVVRAGRDPKRLAAVIDLAARGEVVIPVQPFPLDEIVEAHRTVESRHSDGKVVLLIAS